MAETRLTVQSIVRAGVVEALVAGDQANGHDFINDGETFVYIINADASPTTLVFDAVKQVRGEPVTDRTVIVAAGTEVYIGPFPGDLFNQSDEAQVNFTLSNDTAITLGAFSLKN